MGRKKSDKSTIDKTKVILAAILIAGAIILAYIFAGDERPEIDIPTPNGDIHIERKSNNQ